MLDVTEVYVGRIPRRVDCHVLRYGSEKAVVSMDVCSERKNVGKMLPLSSQTIVHRWPHLTGDFVLRLESSHPWGVPA